ncbi:hypothetical protein H4Q26_004369 [Puccinia striiformis f. sp. tritici PST-130]|nr:hypothetical protein H4Q26_004369 [Puccinia striiformis f. sp. tritici PST-130]
MALLLPHRRLVLLAVCFSEATRCIGINDEWLTCREVEKECVNFCTTPQHCLSKSRESMESEMICTPTNVEPVTEVNDAPTRGRKKRFQRMLLSVRRGTIDWYEPQAGETQGVNTK